MIGMLSVIAYSIGRIIFGENSQAPRTMCFSVLALSQLFHAFNMCSENSVLGKRFFRNKFLVMSLVLGCILQICVVNVPFMSGIFKTAPLGYREWGIVFGLSVVPIIIVELQKLFSKFCE